MEEGKDLQNMTTNFALTDEELKKFKNVNTKSLEELKKLSNEDPKEFLKIMTSALQQVVDEKNREMD